MRKKELEELQKEKEELLKIKEILENKEERIDISEIYAFTYKDTTFFVKEEKEEIKQATHIPLYKITLIDIFNNENIYEKISTERVQRKEYIGVYDERYKRGDVAYINHLYEVEKDLLTYPNKKIPEYVLIQTFYKLNNVNVKNPILTRSK